MPTTANRRRRVANRRATGAGALVQDVIVVARNILIIVAAIYVISHYHRQRGDGDGDGVGGDAAVRRSLLSVEDDDAADEAEEGRIRYADKYIRQFEQVAQDPDCMNPQVDAASADFDPPAAAAVFLKCRLLVIKNAYDKSFLAEYRKDFTKFMTGLKTGRISTDGTTTNGDSTYFANRGRGRWEIILPEDLAHPRLVANANILKVLRHPHVLGNDMELRSLQSTNAQQYATGQQWHYDQGFLFGDDNEGLETFGIAGHDMPPFSVTAGVPMMDLARDLGPTEFCMGSSAVSGVPDHPRVKDRSLIEEGSLWHEWNQYDDWCPPSMLRSPLLEFGDIVLFDYAIWHRGGWNDSPYMRAVLLLVYSKTWFDDINFGSTVRKKVFKEEGIVQNLLWRPRLARPNKVGEPGKEEEGVELKDIGDFNPDGSVHLEDYEIHKEEAEFIASNVDVGGDDTVLYLNGAKIGRLPPGETRLVEGVLGDVMELRSGSGEVEGKWSLKFNGQIFFSKDMMV